MKPTTARATMPISAADEGNTPPSAKPRPATSKPKKSRKKKSAVEPMSGWGCLWRSVVVTLVLFAAYVFLGLLLESLQ